MKPKFYVPTPSVDPTHSWRMLLADPEKHWREGYSARMLAESWEAKKDFPSSFRSALEKAGLNLELVFGFPEMKVELDNYGKASQNDLFVVARDQWETFCIAVEGKVKEDFGPLIQTWYQNPSTGKIERLKGLLSRLHLDPDPKLHFNQRYQLYHRTVSALQVAEKLHAKNAMLVVHSFSQADEHLEDFNDFIGLLEPGLKLKSGEIKPVLKLFDEIKLWVGWVRGPFGKKKERSEKADHRPDSFRPDLESEFWRLAEAFSMSKEANSYIISYPHFINYFRQVEVITEQELIVGIHFVYGWMPTIFSFGKENTLSEVLLVLNKAKHGGSLDLSDYGILKKYLNNSLVGTSKLLHFINPQMFAIWDSKICRFVLGKAPHEYRVGKISNYLAYIEFLKKITADLRFHFIDKKVNDMLSYQVKASPFRLAELIMFAGGSNLSKPFSSGFAD